MKAQEATLFDLDPDIRCPDGVILTETGQYQCAGCGLFPNNCCCPDMPEVYVIELAGEFDMTGGGYKCGPSPVRNIRVGVVCENGVLIKNGEPRCINCGLAPYNCCCPDKPIVYLVDIGDVRCTTPDYHPGGHMDI
ncbi:MAG: hypothetical protein WCT33_03265 [Patescibacteria group bacterium]